jgi:transposase
MKFLSLTPDQFAELDAALQGTPCSGRYFKRIQSIKLNAQGYSIPRISQLLDVHYNSVYHWLLRYENQGIEGLRDQPKSGCPRRLSETDQPLIEAWVKETPNQPKTVLARIEQELDKTIHRNTLKRALKRWDYTYRRARTSLHSKQDDIAVAKKKRDPRAPDLRRAR